MQVLFLWCVQSILVRNGFAFFHVHSFLRSLPVSCCLPYDMTWFWVTPTLFSVRCRIHAIGTVVLSKSAQALLHRFSIYPHCEMEGGEWIGFVILRPIGHRGTGDHSCMIISLNLSDLVESESRLALSLGHEECHCECCTTLKASCSNDGICRATMGSTAATKTVPRPEGSFHLLNNGLYDNSWCIDQQLHMKRSSTASATGGCDGRYD